MGSACHALGQHRFAERVRDNRRAAQGILRLGQSDGPVRREAAGRRALELATPRHRTVKTLLANGVDQLPRAEPAFDTVAARDTGQGRFYRDVGRRLSPGGPRSRGDGEHP